MKTVSIIRNRGQLTIPDAIRQFIPWVAPLSVVSLTLTRSDEIVIRPHDTQRQIDWDSLWAHIKRVRAFRGRGTGNLSGFIAEDRKARR